VTAFPDHRDQQLIGALADRQKRAAAAQSLATHIGVRSLLVLVWDKEVDSLHPAPGFPQTLPGGPTWRALLKRCREPGAFEQEVQLADHSREIARAFATSDRSALVLLGGEPRVSAREIVEAAPLLISLLQLESRDLAREGYAQAAADAQRRAAEVAAALDTAHRSTARLNHELNVLNATLEERVRTEIAERMKAEQALRQAQKMEAIGQLTGGVAHDFNNLLTVMMGSLDAMNRQLGGAPDALDLQRMRRSCSMALQAAQRAASLTARLLAFSRRQPLEPKPLNADRLIHSLADMLQRLLGETVKLEVVSTPGLWLALADPNELEHAVLNIVVNARDAMPEGGHLTLETANVYLDEDYLQSIPEPVQPGQYVMLSVTDTGHGMAPDTLEHIFEPFFTTKDAGKGTGLGLSQVYGFIRQSGGHVRVYSELGSGTTVKLYLPRLLAGESTPDAATAGSSAADVASGSESILVVEDDEAVRHYSTGVLRDLGYRVLETHNGASALELLRQNVRVDLLFTDVVLPDGMHGRELADEAQLLRPGLKILFTSGYSRNAIVHNGRLDPGVSLLMKPFTHHQLARRIRTILDR
jgi:signal transduction histidine kinase